MKIVKILNENNEWTLINILNESRPVKWTYDECYKEAQKYKTVKEFYTNNSWAYEISSKNGWLRDFDWLSINSQGKLTKWTYDECYKEAQKYKTLKDFHTNNQSAYEISSKNGWLKDFDWLDRIYKTWTYDECYKEAQKYKTVKDFYANNRRAYTVSIKNDWLKDFDWLDRVTKAHWTYDKCYNEAQKYKTLKDFRTNNQSAYIISYKHGWLKDFDWLDKGIRGRSVKWTYDDCYKEAQKYKTLKDFRTNSAYAYIISLKNGWMNDFYWLRESENSDYINQLNEMLNPVPVNVLYNCIVRFFNNRYQIKNADQYIKKEYNELMHKQSKSVVNYRFTGKIADKVDNDSTVKSDLQAYLKNLKYRSIYYGTKIHCEPIIQNNLFKNSKYENIFYRQSAEHPSFILKNGFRSKGHRYAYHIGKIINHMYKISSDLNLNYTDEDIYKFVLNLIKGEDMKYTREDIKNWDQESDELESNIPIVDFGRYRFIFTYNGPTYLDTMDGEDRLNIDSIDIHRIENELKNKSNVALSDIYNKLEENNIYWWTPIYFEESIPVQNITYLYDVYDEACNRNHYYGKFYNAPFIPIK